MLSRGRARVYSFPDNRTRVAAMMALERAARVARRGIWAHPFYRVRDADRVRSDKGTFQLVEGRVLDVATVKGRTYMNFGPDWRRDFMISIGRRHRKAFRGRWPALDILEGRLVRVRGWLIWRNGPMIEATHPEQIEVLE